MARGERSGEMNSGFIRTHIDLPLLCRHHLYSHSVVPHAPPMEKKNKRRLTGKTVKSRANLSGFSDFASGSRGEKIR